MARLRLYGRRVTDEQVSLEVYNLTHGLGKKPHPLSARDTAKFSEHNYFFVGCVFVPIN